MGFFLFKKILKALNVNKIFYLFNDHVRILRIFADIIMRKIFFHFFISCSLFSCWNSTPNKKLAAVDSLLSIEIDIDAKKKKFVLDTFFQHRFAAHQFSGCVLVAQRGVVLYEKSFGWSNYINKDSMKLSSEFQIASVSKQFTAAAIMLLHQQGKLNYEDSVGKYIAGFDFHSVTIKELLTHRAGLDKYTNICDHYYHMQHIQPTVFNNDSVLAIMESLHSKPIRSHGKKFDYSNTGYVILASIVEKISKQTFHQFMTEQFFDPLNMHHTWLCTDGLKHLNKTNGYYADWDAWDENFLDQVTGDKGVYSCVEDMYLWDRSLRNNLILKPEIMDSAFIGYSPDLVTKKYWNYGFGWRTISFEDGAKAVFHNGWWHGYTSVFYRGLSDDVTIIILSNKYNSKIYNVQPILAILGAHCLPDAVHDLTEIDSIGSSIKKNK